jgi:hydroxyethylthiazole kinase-like uncharacterized protein yjeF
MRSLTRLEVRQIDKTAIESLGVAGVVLMENAGRGAADAIENFCRQRKITKDMPVAIVAGCGNNGGDGFVIARHLSLKGQAVRTYVLCRPEKLTAENFTPDAFANLKIIQALRLDVCCLDDREISHLANWLSPAGLVVDAIGGTGIVGPLAGLAARAVDQINSSGKSVVAIDIPTGLDCDTGQACGSAVRAELTVTFVARKVGFDQPGAAEYTGMVVTADIGIPPEAIVAS